MRQMLSLVVVLFAMVCSINATQAGTVGVLVDSMDPYHDIPVNLTSFTYDATLGQFSASGITDGGTFTATVNFSNPTNATGTVTVTGMPLVPMEGEGVHTFTSSQLDIFDNTAYPGMIGFRFFADTNAFTPANSYVLGFLYPESMVADVGLAMASTPAVPAPASVLGGLALGVMILGLKLRRHYRVR